MSKFDPTMILGMRLPEFPGWLATQVDVKCESVAVPYRTSASPDIQYARGQSRMVVTVQYEVMGNLNELIDPALVGDDRKKVIKQIGRMITFD